MVFSELNLLSRRSKLASQDGLLSEKDIEQISQAMGAIRLIRNHYASGVDGQRLMQEVLTMLRAGNLVCKNIADAIDAANRNKRVQEAPLQSAAA
jgi:hypothetical protein